MFVTMSFGAPDELCAPDKIPHAALRDTSELSERQPRFMVGLRNADRRKD
jgi:hypothetical protein